MYGGSSGTVWVLSPWMKRGCRGINSLHTKSNRYTHLTNIRQNAVDNSNRPICSNIWTLGISVGPRGAFQFDRLVQWLGLTSFGGTDFAISVTLIWRQKATNTWQPNLGETESQNWKIWFARVWIWLGVVHLGEFGLIFSVGPRWLFRVYDSGSCWGIWRYTTKHLSNQIIIKTSSPFNSIGFPMDWMWSWITKPKIESWAFANACL
jgi:hypothetical protein